MGCAHTQYTQVGFQCNFKSDVLDNTCLLLNTHWCFGTFSWLDSLRAAGRMIPKTLRAWSLKLSLLRFRHGQLGRDWFQEQLWVFKRKGGLNLHIHADIQQNDSYFEQSPPPHVCQWETKERVSARVRYSQYAPHFRKACESDRPCFYCTCCFCAVT